PGRRSGTVQRRPGRSWGPPRVNRKALLVVAVDGPSGVGKSTVARRLATALGVPYLDTGAMYRSLALKALRSGIDPGAREACEELAERTDIGLREAEDGSFQVLLDGEPVGDSIRTPEVSSAASAIAEHPGVRRRMVHLQRATAERHGGVLEGRDIGTRVFPETPFKFFLDARPEIRAGRRYRQLRDQGKDVARTEVERDLEARDRRDRERSDSPLTRDDSYCFVDTSDAPADEVVERMLETIRATSSSA
ncbi:MAG: (d)CMP kinase, partial [Acidobacteria bacterium]|nr:(d)CMP kinase [Acidobacteriota bacterium]